jgi:hypothetical protein
MDVLSREYSSTILSPKYLYPKSSENKKVLTDAFRIVGVRQQLCLRLYVDSTKCEYSYVRLYK